MKQHDIEIGQYFVVVWSKLRPDPVERLWNAKRTCRNFGQCQWFLAGF